MEQKRLKELLEAVAGGAVTPDDAMERLRNLPFEDIGFAKVDHHRHLRKGYPETVFAQGKTPEQVVAIVTRMREHGSNVLATRCCREVVDAVVAAHPDAVHHEIARALTITVEPPRARAGYAAVVCAGTSDMPVAEEAAVTCEALGTRVNRVYDVGVAGLHRLLEQRPILDGADALVVCAGMECGGGAGGTAGGRGAHERGIRRELWRDRGPAGHAEFVRDGHLGREHR